MASDLNASGARGRWGWIEPPPLEIASVSTLLSRTGDSDGRIAWVENVGFFAYHATSGTWVPAWCHPTYSTFSVVGSLVASDLDPTDPDAVVTGDLPTGWTLTFDGGPIGVAQLASGQLLIDSVSAGGSVVLAYTGTGILTPTDNTDRIVVVARHGWTDDGALAASDANRLKMAMRLRVANTGRLYIASEPNGGSAGASRIATISSGAVTGLGQTSQPRTVQWDVVSRAKATGPFMRAERLAATADGGGEVAAGLLTVDTADDEMSYVVADGAAITVESVVILVEGGVA